MACRDTAKADEARNKIVQETKNENVHGMKLDLSSTESIKNFSNEFKSKFDRLDILINNAGKYKPIEERTTR